MSKKDTTISSIFHGIFLLLIVFCLVSCFLYRSKKDTDYSMDSKSIYDWSDEWKVSYGNVAGETVSFPKVLNVERGSTVIMKKTLPNKIKKYNCIMIEGRRQDIIVNVGGILRSSFSDKETRRIGNSSPDAVLFVPIYSTDEGKDVTLLISSNTESSGEIGKIYLGNEMSLLLVLIEKNILWVLLTISIFAIGIISLITFVNYGKTFEDGRLLIYLFFYAMIATVCCFNQLTIKQMFVRDLAMLDNVSYCCFMLFPVTCLMYAHWLLRGKFGNIVWVAMGICSFNFIVQNALQLLDIVDFHQIRLATLMLTIIVSILIILLCYLDWNREDIRKYSYLLIGQFALLIGGVGELVSGLVHLHIGVLSLYSIGAFVFLGLNYLYTTVSVSKEQQRKKDAESASIAKSQFLATMSHEIRTPINAVLGMNEMILRESNEANIRDYADNISDAGKSLLSLVNDILDFSKIEAGKLEIINTEYSPKGNLNDLIVMIQGRIAQKGLELKLDIDENIPMTLWGDEVRIKQVITNLLTNSAKYTEKGTITFTVKMQEIQGDQGKLYVSVKDTGIGIKPEDLERLMDSSFVRVDEEKNRKIEGTGLGLSITRQLLELMGSKLEVDSEYGKGSDFHFVLTQKIIDQKPMGSVLEKEHRNERKLTNTFTAPEVRILAVDDNKMNRKVITGLLKPYMAQVESCESGQGCLELCEENVYDLILMDHMMPEMDGIETFKRLKRMPSFDANKTKVIALTANAVSGAAEMYRENGFDGYMTKPIDVHELDRCLMEYIDESKRLPI